MLNEITKITAIKFDIVTTRWSRLLRMVETGKVDGAFTENFKSERAEYTFFSRQPIHSSYFSLFILTNSDITFNSIDDLAGLRIGLLRDFFAGSEFESAKESGLFTVIEVNDLGQLINMLKQHRFDAFVNAHFPTIHHLSQNNETEIFNHSIAISSINPGFLLLSKASKNITPTIILKINSALDEIYEKGIYEKGIYEKVITNYKK
ncbi:MAG: transporter substrate-binding domain-containing protein [Saccharospirillaceae bacterium]|nr:transporter substrate-binding domain-containing protein [Pseudomonadales bacterium]NRB80204.1 transporter substrate-binding domain-containing protein [Saccharospirillaceae bacterium]